MHDFLNVGISWLITLANLEQVTANKITKSCKVSCLAISKLYEKSTKYEQMMLSRV